MPGRRISPLFAVLVAAVVLFASHSCSDLHCISPETAIRRSMALELSETRAIVRRTFFETQIMFGATGAQ